METVSKKISINVKDESALAFLKEKMTNSDGISLINDMQHQRTSPYNLLKDEIYFKKGNGVEIGDSIVIELNDHSSGSCKNLVNYYHYEAKEYDDVSIKMVLSDFNVHLK